MGRTRLQLQTELEKICSKCYFSPPNGFNLEYDCIVYQIQGDSDQNADDLDYVHHRRYTVTIITEDPDSKLPKRLKKQFDYCRLDRVFCSDDLNHFVHTIYW